MNLHLTLNGVPVVREIVGDEFLIDVLRASGIGSVRLGCGIGICGACTVLLDGDPVSSCLMLAGLAADRSVTTVEGLADDDPALRAFDDAHAFQCGFCTPGMVLAARSLAEHDPTATRRQVRDWMNGNLCRCGSYARIEQAVDTLLREVASAARDV